jgi:predicted dehydrogenase
MIKNHYIDIMLILTPSGFHYYHVKKSLENNINVLVEKPIAMRPNQIENLIKLAKKNKLLFNVAFQNRLNPTIVYIKKLLLKKALGKIVSSSVRLRWCRYQDYYNDDWHGTWFLDGGVLNQQAIHHIDALNYLLGPIESVSSFSTNRINKLQAEDTLVSIFRLKDGSLSTFEATTAARPCDIEASISITGDKGFVDVSGIALNQLKQIKYIGQKEKSIILQKKYSEKVTSGYGVSHKILLKAIFKKLSGSNDSSLIKAETGLATTRIIHAIYKSVEKNKIMHLRNNPLSSKLGKK